MENLYKELRSFFANDIDLTDLFDSEAIIWIDWREYDEDVVNYFNDFVQPDYEVRWFAESLGNDTLGFTVLSGAEWAKLDDEFGADTVRYYFEPIDFESDMFNLGMDEVFALLALRENSEGVNTQFSTQLDWIRIINKEKTLAEQKENGQIDLKQYMVAKKELQQSKDDFIAAHGPMK